MRPGVRVTAGLLLGAWLLMGSPADAARLQVAAVPKLEVYSFRTRGPGGSTDEFVLVYNDQDTPQNTSGFTLRASDATGTTTLLATFPASLAARRKLTFVHQVNADCGLASGTTTYSVDVPDDGGLAVLDAGNQIIDQVGMASGSAYKEGTVLAPLTGTFDKGYQRKDATPPNAQDTGDNAADFRLVSPTTCADGTPDPQVPEVPYALLLPLSALVLLGTAGYVVRRRRTA